MPKPCSILLRLGLVSCLMTALSAIATGAIPAVALDGAWLVERGQTGNVSDVTWARNSICTFNDGTFTVTHFCGSRNDLHGTFTLSHDSSAAMDLNVDAVDVSDVWVGAQYPKAMVPAIFKLGLDQLTICFTTGRDRQRPTGFVTDNIKTHLLTLVRTHAGFERVPPNILISVHDERGHPIPNASIFRFMSFTASAKPTTQPDAWKYDVLGQTNARGVATVRYENLANAAIGASDAERHLVGFASAAPAAIQDGTASVTVHPQLHVRGTLASPDLAGKPIGWTNVYLFNGGERIGCCSSRAGTFDFFVPAGSYRLNAYGEGLRGRFLDMVVPEGQQAFSPPTINLDASRVTQLKQHPAPEFTNVFAWKGTPTKLADLRGKYVLLDFWGYWCGPCVAEMPNLLRLHERFKDKGLAVIGVHVDMSDQVDTVPKLDEKLITIRKRLWDGKDLPFPVALTSQMSAGAKDVEHSDTVAGAYGIHAYPTTIVIDREGNVIGALDVSDEKLAAKQIQEWLDRK